MHNIIDCHKPHELCNSARSSFGILAPNIYQGCREYASFHCFASVFAFVMPHIFVFAQTIPPDLVLVWWLLVLRCIVWILVQTKFGRFTMFRFHYNIVGCSMGIFARLQEFSPTKLECCLNWRGEIELVMLIKDQRLGPNRAKQDEGSDNPHKKQNSRDQYQYPEEQIILPKELLWTLLMQKRTLARQLDQNCSKRVTGPGCCLSWKWEMIFGGGTSCHIHGSSEVGLPRSNNLEFESNSLWSFFLTVWAP